MKRIKKFFTYVLFIFVYPKKLADMVNEANSPEELDELVGGLK